MCTEETKQGYLFLSAFEDASKNYNISQIQQALDEASKQLNGSGYYSHSPRPLEKLFQISVKNGYLERRSRAGWRITDSGKEKREYLYQNYISEHRAA